MLLRVELFEVLGDYWNGQWHDENPGDGTQGSDEFAEASGGVNVPVSHCGHRDHHPVEGGGDVREAGVEVHLYIVAETKKYKIRWGPEEAKTGDHAADGPGEDEAWDGEDHPQEGELGTTLNQGVDYRLQPARVPFVMIMTMNRSSWPGTLLV